VVDGMLDLRDFVEHTLRELDRRVEDDSSFKIAKKANEKLLLKEIEVEKMLDDDEALFLLKVKERLVVLFDSLQDDEIVDLESKLEMTLDFLEYLLSKIDMRLKEKGFE